MPARDEYEFDDDPDASPPPVKGGFPVWLILVLGGVVACLFVCAGLSTLAFLMYRRDVARQEMMVMEMEAMRAEEAFEKEQDAGRVKGEWLRTAREKAQLNRPLPRDEFRSKVAGKSMDEVETAVGKPDSTEERGGDTRWIYERRTLKPDNTLERDSRAVVTFRNGRVAEVAFE